MKQLFNLLPLEYPLTLPEKELKSLLSGREFALLEEIGILALDTPLSNISCQTCGEFHEVHVPSQTEAFYVCPEAGKETVNVHDLKRWRFQYKQLFNSLSRDLSITQEVQELQKGVCWRLGTVQINNEILPVFFYQGKVDDTVVKDFPGIILIATSAQNNASPNCLFGFISLTDILENKSDGEAWSKNKWETLISRRIQKVVFERNGDLMVDGKRIAHADPSSPQFFFLQILYDDYNSPVSQEAAFAYYQVKMAQLHGRNEWSTGYTEQTFCNTMKSLIKKVADDKEMVDKIIQSTKTAKGEKAYRLTHPS